MWYCLHMKMHRVGKVADWVSVAPNEWNYWQRLAARSSGWCTPGNLVSLVGFGFVLAGLASLLHGQSWWGFTLVAVGRSADLLDGAVADKTGTKSPLGEAVDATFDKFELLLALIIFFIVDAIPLAAIVAVTIVNLAIALLSMRARIVRVTLHPSRIGKFATAAQWVAMTLYLLATAMGSHFVVYIADGTLVISIGMAVVAFGMYLWQFTMHRHQQTLVSARAEAE